MFSAFNDESGSIIVTNGDSVEVKTEGKVKLRLRVFNGKRNEVFEVTLNEVLYVPMMNGNLLSIRRLAEKGFKIEFTEEACMLNRRTVSVQSVGKVREFTTFIDVKSEYTEVVFLIVLILRKKIMKAGEKAAKK